jgi:nucleoprotein TPR
LREKLEEELQLKVTVSVADANDKNDVELAKAAASALKLDVEEVRKEAVSAQNNYERELSVHSQARTSLRVALEEAQKEAGLRLAAEQQLDLVRNELKHNIAVWEDEKASLLETSNTLEKSLAGAREQISLLHTQVEKLGDIVEKDQNADRRRHQRCYSILDAGQFPRSFRLRKLFFRSKEMIPPIWIPPRRQIANVLLRCFKRSRRWTGRIEFVA